MHHVKAYRLSKTTGVGELMDVMHSRFMMSAYREILDEVCLPLVRAMMLQKPKPFYLVQVNSHKNNAMQVWLGQHS